MSAVTELTPYIPQFFWRFWLSDADPLKHSLDDHRVHIYDVYNNVLSETRRIPEQLRTVFQDFNTGALDEGCRAALRTAEQAFTRLESEAERILGELVIKIRSSPRAARMELPMSRRSRDALLRFFVFLRYRNSDKYQAMLDSLSRKVVTDNGAVFKAMHAWHRVRRRALLGSFHSFLQHESPDARSFELFESLDCWRFCNAEMCIGVASEGQQFVLPDTCFGTLDEDFGSDPTSGHLFFPIMPTLALYVLGFQGDKPHQFSGCSSLEMDAGAVWIECGVESPSDVHLRNATLLQRYPKHLYFSSLVSIVQSISSYDEFRWISEHLDYSRLKQRCRQKSTLEKVTKTLVVKGSVLLVDLSDEVIRVGEAPVCHGSFSDVWKGIWTNPTTRQAQPVALKFLRQYMADTVREKLLKVRLCVLLTLGPHRCFWFVAAES
ncbi:hypothetical protein BV22DRAFT_658936 [Leucogyrophana mollusca]|uniref:Uncharacterized protein n=1 Tax=Leucogyrophana mollusca TaxID=85980 RepID=A0ACB8BAD7_9AGAM|nr:hypothetical protein BV22DRAFT_658936 [Leucogyrophana mollusca]